VNVILGHLLIQNDEADHDNIVMVRPSAAKHIAASNTAKPQ
jgi:hypothetical protein